MCMSSNMDRISQLPEPILEHILSFLPLKEAARMSGLSTIWKTAYNSISSLKFGGYFFHEPLEKLVNVVHPMLAYRQKHKISIEMFSLGLPCTMWTCQVYNWIDTLVECNIKELNIRVTTSSMPTGYHKLPESIFNAKALKVLRLSGFHIKLPSNCTTIKFSSSLREFHVDHVLIDEEFMQALCTSCCNLEVLILESVDGLASFQTCLPKLKKIELMGYYLSELQLVDISAPNLEDLQIYIFKMYDTLMEDRKVVRMTGCCCKALKRLYLNDLAMTQKWFDEIFSCLENVEKLDLYNCNMLKTIKISSVLLKQLRVHCYNVIDVELDTPNLIRFSYNCTSLPTLKLKASTSLEANITFASGGGTPDRDWYSKLMKFLDNFNHSMAIELTCKNDKALVIPKDMRERLLPPLYGTNCVKVNILLRLNNYSVVDILDNMFWLSPRLDILSYCEPDIKTLEFLYEDALCEDEKLCCTSQRWKCWRHKLKQVKMNNFRCMEKKQELRNYFFTNSDVAEITEVPTERFDPEWR